MKQFFKHGSRHSNGLVQPSPNSFAGLMEMYEGNYMRLRKLLGEKDAIPEVALSSISKGMDLYLQVLEQTKYTSTIVLTYYFSDDQLEFLPYPNIKVRIYYDALQAEVMSQAYRHKNPDFHAFNHQMDPTLLKRWRMNRFLYKWLAFCDRQGHSFNAAARSNRNQLITKNVEIPLQHKTTSSNIIK